jgi:uncharacterized DUF497 family protein
MMVVYSREAVMAGGGEGTEFEWDGGNGEKNWLRHRVSQSESEQVFFNRPFVSAEDRRHSDEEARYYALGQSDGGRLLYVVYTLRGEKVRVISARSMTRAEQKEYELVRAQEFAADPEV